jgi:hypothetical protein
MKKVSLKALEAMTLWSKARVAKEKTELKLGDILFSEGVTPEMLAAPEKGKEPSENFAAAKQALVSGYDARIQALMLKDPKTLSDDDKDTRRKWQMRVGADMRDLVAFIQRRVDRAIREANAASGESGNAQTSKASWESVKRKVLADMIKQAQGKEETSIKDLQAFIKDLQSALARIPANA